MIMFSFIFLLNIYGEPYNTSQLIKYSSFTGKYFIIYFLFIGFYFLWIGIQLPQEKFIYIFLLIILI